MAPIRRYLRITRYSVLEVRIYLDNPSLAETWLLKTNNPALPRVIDAIRPYVLPKLREENERSKRKGGKKNRGTKDTVSQDEFEVSIFLTETSTSHALLTKQKSVADKPRIKSNGKLGINTYFANTTDNPIDVDDAVVPQVLREDDDDNEPRLEDIPEAPKTRSNRGREHGEAIDVSGDDEAFQPQKEVPSRRKRTKGAAQNAKDPTDDKKKMAMTTAYEGFSIYGRILCLIVKKKDVKKLTAGSASSGSDMLESWVSTQANNDNLGDFEDDR